MLVRAENKFDFPLVLPCQKKCPQSAVFFHTARKERDGEKRRGRKSIENRERGGEKGSLEGGRVSRKRTPRRAV